MGVNNGRDKADTQERILGAATELFIARGYERTTVSDIAELAGVSRATVFWHFRDKVSVFRESFNRMLAPFRESLARRWDDVEASKRLEEQIAMSEHFAAEHGVEIAAFVRWALESPQLRSIIVDTALDLNHRFAGALTETISQLLPRHRDPKLVAQSLMLSFDAMLLLGFFDDRVRMHEERSAAVHELIAMINRDAAHG